MSRSNCLIDFSEVRDYCLPELALLAKVFIHQYTIKQHYALKVNNVSTLYKKCLYKLLYCYIKLYSTIQKLGIASYFNPQNSRWNGSETSPNLYQIASDLSTTLKWHSQRTSIINLSKILSKPQTPCVSYQAFRTLNNSFWFFTLIHPIEQQQQHT